MFSVITSLILLINLGYLYADCPAGFFAGVNSEDCFQIIDTPLENGLAQSDCYEKGGYLASIHDVATNLFVGTQLNKIVSSNKLVWLGGFTEYFCSGTSYKTAWKWYDKTYFDYQNFAKDQNTTMFQYTAFNTSDNQWYSLSYNDENGNANTFPYLCKMHNPSIPTPTPTHAPCPIGSFPGLQLNDCFLFNKMQLNFYDSNQFCIGHYGELASIQDTFTNSLIASNLKNSTTQKIWIGGEATYGCTDFRNCQYDWVWVDKTQFNYENFASNDNNPAAGMGVTMSNNDGYWHTNSISEEHAFLCKIPPSR